MAIPFSCPLLGVAMEHRFTVQVPTATIGRALLIRAILPSGTTCTSIRAVSTRTTTPAAVMVRVSGLCVFRQDRSLRTIEEKQKEQGNNTIKQRSPGVESTACPQGTHPHQGSLCMKNNQYFLVFYVVRSHAFFFCCPSILGEMCVNSRIIPPPNSPKAAIE